MESNHESMPTSSNLTDLNGSDVHSNNAGGVADPEKQASKATARDIQSVYAALGWIDRLLALWILLAIIVGMLIGNYVDGAGEALQKGQFVGVSIPIGK